jgi:ATP/maltotriose-dependent transcriptional regulator MalT
MWRESPQQVTLLVDDVHEIPAGSDAAELLAAVVAALPANGHVVLAGRIAPPVPLARLEVQGRVEHLDEADLAFTNDELAEFAALRNVAATQLSASGGWPAMAELSASARPGVAADYVGEEILRPLSPARRKELALLAHLGSLTCRSPGPSLGPTSTSTRSSPDCRWSRSATAPAGRSTRCGGRS